ncbi:hypothetical protein ZEAMMB73_Zm00001d036932 [Zea mays]|uniref:Uncharacterized protein n=2 Tax=Zea mays TaxID=4577 RepID=A0A1D6LSK4_MAIZE|nr:hypothetical protein ZEAMMB73_Zm00001d036932 [Zea mays]
MILNQSSNKSTTNTSCTCSRCFPPHSVVTKCVNRRLIKISPLACEPATNKKVSIYWTYVHVHAALHKICIGYIALLSDLLRSGVQRLPHLGYQMDYISKTEPFYVCMILNEILGDRERIQSLYSEIPGRTTSNASTSRRTSNFSVDATGDESLSVEAHNCILDNTASILSMRSCADKLWKRRKGSKL